MFASGFVDTVSPAQTTAVKATFSGTVSNVLSEPDSWMAGGFYSLMEADFEVPGDMAHKGRFVGAYVNAVTSADVL